MSSHAPGRAPGAWRFPRVPLVLGNVLGLWLGAAAAVVAYDRWGSWFLAAFVFTGVQYVLGRAAADVVLHRRRGARALWHGAAVAAGVAGLLAAAGAGNELWVAALVGWGAGGAAEGLAGALLGLTSPYPDADGREWGEPAPADEIPFRRRPEGR